MKKPVFRKNWLTYPKFQLLLIAINTAIVSIGFGLVAIGLKQFFIQLQQTGQDSGLNPNHYYFIFLGNQASRLYWITGIAWVSSVVICAVASLFLSSKIVGPIVRLKTYFQAMTGEHETKPLRFRDGDFFLDLPEAVNHALKDRGVIKARD